MRLADYVISKLFDEGVQHVFTVTGRGILYLTDALAKHNEIKTICTHHEQAASFAAVSYAQYNNNLGSCIVSTGCGATNALTGLLSAWQDNVPCIFISGQNLLKETSRGTKINIRTFGSQEADIISIVQSITKYAVMIENPNSIVYELDKAIHLAKNGRKGPVWIDIPVDVQNMRIDFNSVEHFIPHICNQEVTIEEKEYIEDAFTKAKRPIILIGSGIRSANMIEEFISFIETHKIPVIYSHSSPDTYGTKNKYSIGAIGSMGGSRAGNFAVQNSDLLLVLGCRLSPFTTGSEYDKFARNAKIIVVDIDIDEHRKQTINIDKFINCDLEIFIKEISMLKISECNIEWLSKCQHWKQIFSELEPQFISQEKVNLYDFTVCLSHLLPNNFSIITDSGLEELIIPSNIRLNNTQRFIHPTSQGSMGYALPASIGVYLSNGHNVITIIGDGSIMMNLQELQTISHNQFSIKIIIINNNLYATIRERQKDLFRSRTIGTDNTNGISVPDFKQVAKCFGIKYCRIDSPKELHFMLQKVFNFNGPIICEVMADENQKYIHNSFTLDKNRKFVKRGLEDQSPFLDRELFLSEMIIDPIDQ